jgi:molybdenum cofactor cytidylyltransferase
MRLATVALEEAVGHILRHNISDDHGRKAFAKGRLIQADDLSRLHELGHTSLRVAILEEDDVHENEAAQRLAAAISGAGVNATPAHAARANLQALYPGPLSIDIERLYAINNLDGLTIATLRKHSSVQERQILATIKVIPFAVPKSLLEEAEKIASDGPPIIQVQPLTVLEVGVILVASARARQRIESVVFPAIEGRVAALQAAVVQTHVVAPDEQAVADALKDLRHAGVGLIIVAGETSIMDQDDVTPQAIRLAGGRIEHYGAPVEPGNLLLLAYFDAPQLEPLPILGAPGCVRSRDTNIVDLLLPRLLAGEQVRRADIITLGHGGLL